MKDTIYFPLYALYAVKYIDIFEAVKGDRHTPAGLVLQYLLVSILLMFTRNNGFYIVVFSTIALLVISNKSKKYLLVSLAIMILLTNWGYHNVLLPINNVRPGGMQEMLSVPFQQTARYVKYYGSELSEEDKIVIDNILDYKKLAKNYNPDKADPVKDTFRDNVSKEDLYAFAKTWWGLLRKHPGVCAQATLNNIYGYFYPAYKCKVLLSYNYYIETKNHVATGDLNIHYYNSQSTWQDGLRAYSDFWQIAPGLAMLESPGFYTWILIILMSLLIRYRCIKELTVMVVPLLHIAICLVSPVNGLLRYAMPLMAAMPVLICWTVKMINDRRMQ